MLPSRHGWCAPAAAEPEKQGRIIRRMPAAAPGTWLDTMQVLQAKDTASAAHPSPPRSHSHRSRRSLPRLPVQRAIVEASSTLEAAIDPPTHEPSHVVQDDASRNAFDSVGGTLRAFVVRSCIRHGESGEAGPAAAGHGPSGSKPTKTERMGEQNVARLRPAVEPSRNAA